MQSERDIADKDASPESSTRITQTKLEALGFQVEGCAWRNPVGEDGARAKLHRGIRA